MVVFSAFVASPCGTGIFITTTAFDISKSCLRANRSSFQKWTKLLVYPHWRETKQNKHNTCEGFVNILEYSVERLNMVYKLILVKNQKQQISSQYGEENMGRVLVHYYTNNWPSIDWLITSYFITSEGNVWWADQSQVYHFSPASSPLCLLAVSLCPAQHK